ncbi:MAG: beta-N-acetylhexosaminidase [Acutalibacteraceae bacterium]
MLSIIPKPNFTKEYGGKRKIREDEIVFQNDNSFLEETYEIEITKDKAVITSKGEKGKFYALQTLRQLKDENGSVPLVKITDFPRFSYRAFMIDSARHMQTVDEIKRYIEAAARYKFNYFHWHLCDDQGFRMECEKYPMLNKIGSFRKGHGFGSKNESVYGGYYTKSEIKEIIDFCKERYIEVIPEIDLPGHTMAMLASYPYLACGGKKVEVSTKPGVHKDILCAGKEETFDFCFGLLDEVMELFPSEYIHIGGDEAPKVRWKECADCQRRMKEENLKDEEELQGYFVGRISDYVKSKGKKPIAWNESLNSGMLSKDVIVCDWLDKKHKSEEFANAGGKIIAEDFFSLYLDYPYGMTPLKKTYTFNPILKDLDEKGKENVIGIESPIWTEFVEDFDRMSYMCFPRLLAAAEIGWTNEENKNYKCFVARAKAAAPDLENLGITMADSRRWDPKPLRKAGDVLGHYKQFLTPDLVKTFLFPGKE